MAFFEMLPGAGMPSGLQAGMDSVLNKKFGTSTTYPAEGWPDTVNLMGPLPEKTVSGSIVTFADGAEEVPLKKCEITLPASLDGYSEVDVVHCGKNLVDGYIDYSVTNKIVEPQLYKVGTYTFSCVRATNINGIYVRKGSSIDLTAESISKKINTLTNTFTVSEEGYYFIQIYRSTLSPTWEDEPLSNVMVEVGPTASTFEPYSGTTHTATLGRTIYCGTADVVKGPGESKGGKIVFDGSADENWTAYAGGNGYLIAVADMERGTWYTSEFAESSPLPKVPDNSTLGVRIGVNNNGIYVVQANTLAGVTDLASFKAYLAENPLTVIYPLDDSEIFTFDPVPIDSKLGNNTLWSEQGDLEVTYRADIELALGE